MGSLNVSSAPVGGATAPDGGTSEPTEITISVPAEKWAGTVKGIQEHFGAESVTIPPEYFTDATKTRKSWVKAESPAVIHNPTRRLDDLAKLTALTKASTPDTYNASSTPQQELYKMVGDNQPLQSSPLTGRLSGTGPLDRAQSKDLPSLREQIENDPNVVVLGDMLREPASNTFVFENQHMSPEMRQIVDATISEPPFQPVKPNPNKATSSQVATTTSPSSHGHKLTIHDRLVKMPLVGRIFESPAERAFRIALSHEPGSASNSATAVTSKPARAIDIKGTATTDKTKPTNATSPARTPIEGALPEGGVPSFVAEAIRTQGTSLQATASAAPTPEQPADSSVGEPAAEALTIGGTNMSAPPPPMEQQVKDHARAAANSALVVATPPASNPIVMATIDNLKLGVPDSFVKNSAKAGKIKLEDIDQTLKALSINTNKVALKDLTPSPKVSGSFNTNAPDASINGRPFDHTPLATAYTKATFKQSSDRETLRTALKQAHRNFNTTATTATPSNSSTAVAAAKKPDTSSLQPAQQGSTAKIIGETPIAPASKPTKGTAVASVPARPAASKTQATASLETEEDLTKALHSYSATLSLSLRRREDLVGSSGTFTFMYNGNGEFVGVLPSEGTTANSQLKMALEKEVKSSKFNRIPTAVADKLLNNSSGGTQTIRANNIVEISEKGLLQASAEDLLTFCQMMSPYLPRKGVIFAEVVSSETDAFLLLSRLTLKEGEELPQEFWPMIQRNPIALNRLAGYSLKVLKERMSERSWHGATVEDQSGIMAWLPKQAIIVKIPDFEVRVNINGTKEM